LKGEKQDFPTQILERGFKQPEGIANDMWEGQDGI
jgi:hypothetical protein